MNETFENNIPMATSNHPDRPWLTKTKGWAFNGTLTFAKRRNEVDHSLLKTYFGLYNFHLNGEYNWKNVPVYWRWETDKTERLHCHFVLLGNTPEFDWLSGSENEFRGAMDVADWMGTNWRHGKSEFAKFRDAGWIHYITKDNPVMDSCFTPPIHFLKRKVAAGRDGWYFPWLYRSADKCV